MSYSHYLRLLLLLQFLPIRKQKKISREVEKLLTFNAVLGVSLNSLIISPIAWRMELTLSSLSPDRKLVPKDPQEP